MKNGIMVEFVVERNGIWPIPAQVTLELTDLKGQTFAAESQQAMIQEPVQRLAIPMRWLQAGQPLSLYAIKITARAITVSATRTIHLFEILDRPRMQVFSTASDTGVCTALLLLRTIRSGLPIPDVQVHWTLKDTETDKVWLQGTEETSADGFTRLNLPLPFWQKGATHTLSLEATTVLGSSSNVANLPKPGLPDSFQAVALCNPRSNQIEGILVTTPPGQDVDSLGPIACRSSMTPPLTLAPGTPHHAGTTWQWLVPEDGESGSIIGSSPASTGIQVFPQGTPVHLDPMIPADKDLSLGWLVLPEMGVLIPGIENQVFVVAMKEGIPIPNLEFSWSLGGETGVARTQEDGVAALSILTREESPVIRITAGPPNPTAIDVPLAAIQDEGILVTSSDFWIKAENPVEAQIWTPDRCQWVIALASTPNGAQDLRVVPVRDGLAEWKASLPSASGSGPVRLQIWAPGTNAPWMSGGCIWFPPPRNSLTMGNLHPVPAESSRLTWQPTEPAPSLSAALAVSLDIGAFSLPDQPIHPMFTEFAQAAILDGAWSPAEQSVMRALILSQLRWGESEPPVSYDSLEEETLRYAERISRQIEDDLQILAFASALEGTLPTEVDSRGLTEPGNWIDPWGEPYDIALEEGEVIAHWGDDAWAKADSWDILRLFAARTGGDVARISKKPALLQLLKHPLEAPGNRGSVPMEQHRETMRYAVVVPCFSADISLFTGQLPGPGEQSLLLTPGQGIFPLKSEHPQEIQHDLADEDPETADKP
jgi:hypothetical protein